MIWPFVVAGIVLVDVVIAGVIIRYAVVGNWGPIATAYPSQPPAAGAVHRGFQSFKLGILNLGYSIHVSADDAHLHLEPVRFFRWCGAHAASIPWSAITIVKRHRNGRWTTVRIAPRTTLVGPAWCLDLADPDAGA